MHMYTRFAIDKKDISIPNIDIPLSTRASENTLSAIKLQADSILNRLNVNLDTRASENTLLAIKSQTDKLSFDANNRLAIQNPPNLDVALSTIARENTLSAIKSQTDKLTFDTANRLAVQNPPNLDVLLSSRASESTLSAIKSQTDKLTFDANNRLAVQNPPNLDVALSTRATESTLATIKDRTVPVLKGSIFNTSISANTNIFSSDLTPSYSPTLFRIYVCFNAAGVLTVRRTRGGTTVSEILNAGNNLNANCAYMFDVIVESGDSINLQYSVAATAICIRVVEVPMCQ